MTDFESWNAELDQLMPDNFTTLEFIFCKAVRQARIDVCVNLAGALLSHLKLAKEMKITKLKKVLALGHLTPQEYKAYNFKNTKDLEPDESNAYKNQRRTINNLYHSILQKLSELRGYEISKNKIRLKEEKEQVEAADVEVLEDENVENVEKVQDENLENTAKKERLINGIYIYGNPTMKTVKIGKTEQDWEKHVLKYTRIAGNYILYKHLMN